MAAECSMDIVALYLCKARMKWIRLRAERNVVHQSDIRDYMG